MGLLKGVHNESVLFARLGPAHRHGQRLLLPALQRRKRKECITGSGLSEGRLRTSLYIPHSETKAKQSVTSLVGRAFGLIS